MDSFAGAAEDFQAWLTGRASELTTAHPVAPPIYQTSTFWSPDAEGFHEMATADRHPGFYTRYGNPTTRLLEDAVARLEGAEAALATASGMSAIVAVVLTFGAGGHVAAQQSLYGGATGLLRNLAPRLGIGVSFFDGRDSDAVSGALRPDTRLVILETPSNPLLQLTDIQAVCARVRAVGEAVVMVDNTLATPIIQRPLTLGADLAMHSLTKSVGGHSDITGGLVAGDRTRIVEVWRTALMLGATLDPFAAWLALRGLRTLELRVLRQSQTALAVAERLAAHPKISAVHYPGLASHPQATLAQRQMPGGGGGVLSFEVEGGLKAAERVVSAMRRAHRAASFGSVSTLVVHPAAMWAGMMSEAHLHEASVPPGLIRLGVGLDGAQGVIDDIEQALSHA